MRQKWWLRGTKLVQLSQSQRLTPRADYANAPPFLPLDPVVESKAVHNLSGYSVDEGNDEWFLGRDDYLNENGGAPPPDQCSDDTWNWGADYVEDITPEIEATAQTSHLDNYDMPPVDQTEAFSSEDGYDDPLIDLTEASVGPVQPNAPNVDSPPEDPWAWDDFDADDWWHGSDQAQEPSEIAGQADDLAVEDVTDDWWHALDSTQDPSELASQTEWPWSDDDVGDDVHTIVDDDDDAAGPDQPPSPVEDGWPWQIQDDVGEPFEIQEPPGITLPALPPPEDAWPWDVDLQLDGVPSGYMQANLVVQRQEGDVQWNWDEDSQLFVVPTSYLQTNFVTPPASESGSFWHWESDYVEDEWADFIERIGLNGATGADRTVSGDPAHQNLLRRREDFVQEPRLVDDWHWESQYVEDEWSEWIEPIGPNGATGLNVDVAGDPLLQNMIRRRDDFANDPPRDEDWVWNPTEADDGWWAEATFVQPDAAAASQALAYPDAWDWYSDDTEEAPTDHPGAKPDLPVDPRVAGDPLLQNLLRRRDDFETDPPRDEDWDWYQLDPQEELPLDSGPVVDTQVLFLEFPLPDAFDHFPPEPDNDWVEPSSPVVPDVDVFQPPRVSEEHDWKHWEDGEGDYEIEPSQPVDAPSPPSPDGWVWDEDGIQDDWWHVGTGDFKNSDFTPIPGPVASDEPWHWDGESTDADSWWAALTTPDTDGSTGPDLCPILLAQAYARIAELEAELAECRRHHGDDGGGGGASGDGDDIDHGHGHHGDNRDHDGEQRDILREREEARRRRIDESNRLLMALAGALIHGLKKGPDK